MGVPTGSPGAFANAACMRVDCAPRSTFTQAHSPTHTCPLHCARAQRVSCRAQKSADRQPSRSLLHLVDRLQPIHGCQQPDSTLVRSTAAAPPPQTAPAAQLLRGARSACDERRSPPIDSPVASLAHYCTWWTACNRFTVASSRTVRLCGRQQPPAHAYKYKYGGGGSAHSSFRQCGRPHDPLYDPKKSLVP